MAGRGRPALDEKKRKSEPVSIRLTPALKARLDEERKRAQPERTLSQEIESRLSRSLDGESLIQQRFGTTETYALLRLTAELIKEAQNWTGESWRRDRFTYDIAAEAIQALFEGFRPPGRSVAPKAFPAFLPESERASLRKAWAKNKDEIVSVLLNGVCARVLRAIADPEAEDAVFREIAAEIGNRLTTYPSHFFSLQIRKKGNRK